MYFVSQNRLGLQTRERLYSTNVANVTINGGTDDHIDIFLGYDVSVK